MTRFARGRKCGAFGASGLVASAAPAAGSKPASPTEPIPMPQRARKSRRVKAAVFSALDARGFLEGAQVLDLYAGTAGLAIEAVSRGADAAVVVESAPAALAKARCFSCCCATTTRRPDTSNSMA